MNTHEIIVRGGLGNQLFCLLQAFRIKQLRNNSVNMNISYYSKLKVSNKRSFALDKIYPEINKDFNIINLKRSKIKLYAANLIEKLFIKQSNERLLGDKQFKLNYFPNKYIHSGYFQNINRSDTDQKALSEMINAIKPQFPKKKKLNYLGIHIRRGDYLSKKHNIHGLITEDFFLKEAKLIFKNEIFDGITIFTDSPDIVKIEEFKNINKNIKVDQGGDPVDVFKRMVNHKGLIASNSTFSLWAGIIGKIKYFSIPMYWMKGNKSSLLGLQKIRRYKNFL